MNIDVIVVYHDDASPSTHMLPGPTGKRVPDGMDCNSSPGMSPNLQIELANMGSEPIPCTRTQTRAFRPMIP